MWPPSHIPLLLERPRPVGEIVEPCGLSQPGTSKHLTVPIAELDAWLAPYRRLWNRSLDALGRRLDETASDDPEEPAPKD